MPQLKLIALEPSDLTIVSAHLQDAVVKVADMAFSRQSNRFAALCNRLDRQGDGAPGVGERRRSALRIDRVRGVRIHGFNLADRATVLSVLALTFMPSPDPAAAPAGCLTIVCAGNVTLRLDVECVELVLEDLGPAWRAGAVPEHTSD